MNKNLTYKNKIEFDDISNKDNKVKIELVITSNHNLSDDILNSLNYQLKAMYISNYIQIKEKPKKKI